MQKFKDITLKILVPIPALLFILTGCTQNKTQTPAKVKEQSKIPDMTMAIVYYQKAGEVKAQCYQAYNCLNDKIDESLNLETKMKKAIILDVDETVLDNSKAMGSQQLANKPYPYAWNEWVNLISAEAVPGAIKTLNYGKSKDIEIFYITNRKDYQKKATIQNLKKDGFPFADDTHVLCQTTTSDKTKRRQKVEKDFTVIAYVGDNLNDFSNDYEKKNVKERNLIVENDRDNFGEKFIVLPNPMYGDWLNAIFNYNYDLTNDDKNKILKDNIEEFKMNE